MEIRFRVSAAFGNRRFWRSSLLAACIAATLGWLIAPLGTALADDKQNSPPPAKPRYPNRYDFRWRTPPLPQYIVAMSQDDPLCDSIAKAFNDASTPKGAPPGSLYKAPMFIKWQHDPYHLGHQDSDDVDIVTANPCDEGQSHLFARFRLFSSHGAEGWWSYGICEFGDESNLSAKNWKSLEDMIKDPKCMKIYDNYLYHTSVKDSVMLPTFSPADFNRLPRERADRPDLEVPSQLHNGPETNFILRDGVEYIVLRNPVTEVTLVTQFKGRTDPPKNICLIGSNVPIEIPLQHPILPRKKLPQ